MSHALSPLGRAMVTSGGLGYLRPAPGTWGSLPPIGLAALLIAAGAPALLFHALLITTLILFTAACVVCGDAAEAYFNKKDPSHIVADETAGQCIPLLFLPAVATASPANAAITLAAAFFAFRLFDIFKPPPANRLQRLPGGWGVVLDDLFAGFYAAIAVQLLTRLAL